MVDPNKSRRLIPTHLEVTKDFWDVNVVAPDWKKRGLCYIGAQTSCHPEVMK
jgi:hypothetical protein